MDDNSNLELIATHGRQFAMSRVALLSAITTVALAASFVTVLMKGPHPLETLDCRVEIPSRACLAQLPGDLQNLPAASMGAWYYADNADNQRSARRYLEAEARWASQLPKGITGAKAVGKEDGMVPSPAASQGELRMRRAVLPELWEPPVPRLQLLVMPLGIATFAVFAVSIATGLRSRSWAPVKVRVTADHVSIGDDKLAIADLMPIAIAPLRLSTSEKVLTLPDGYDLAPEDHDKLVDRLQSAMASDMFDDDEDEAASAG